MVGWLVGWLAGWLVGGLEARKKGEKKSTILLTYFGDERENMELGQVSTHFGGGKGFMTGVGEKRGEGNLGWIPDFPYPLTEKWGCFACRVSCVFQLKLKAQNSTCFTCQAYED